MARAVQRPAARRDFIIHYVYLAENAGLDVAKRTVLISENVLVQDFDPSCLFIGQGAEFLFPSPL